MDGALDLTELASPWRLTSPTFTEIEHPGRGSRTWWVACPEGRFVAKLSFDRRCFVEPGLRVAAAVAASGVFTGAPVLTTDGEVCVDVDRIGAPPWTLALLTAVPGHPLTATMPGSEQVAGDLLGRVHAFLGTSSRRDWVPADLLEWLAALAGATGNIEAATVVRTVADRRGTVRSSVLYGDPSPEVLVTTDGAVGLIDWGTPSWGPQLHDVAVWLRWLGEQPGSGSRREARFLGSYAAHTPLSETDISFLPLYGAYAEAFGWAS